MAVRLFVGNLSYDTTEADLRDFFSSVGQLSYVYIPTDRETGRPRGFAFVEYADRAQAEEAIRRFNSQMFKGRPLAVNEARAKEERPRLSSGSQSYAQRTNWTPEGAPVDPPASGNKPSRNFGPDASPRRKGKSASRAQKAERGPKGPIRERTGGQLSWVGDDDSYEDDYDGENFASSLSDEEE